LGGFDDAVVLLLATDGAGVRCRGGGFFAGVIVVLGFVVALVPTLDAVPFDLGIDFAGVPLVDVWTGLGFDVDSGFGLEVVSLVAGLLGVVAAAFEAVDFAEGVGFVEVAFGVDVVVALRGVGFGFGLDFAIGVGVAVDVLGFFPGVVFCGEDFGCILSGRAFVGPVAGLVDRGAFAFGTGAEVTDLGPEPLVEVDLTEATAVEALLDTVITEPYRPFSSALTLSQKFPFFAREGWFFFSSAALRSCQKVPPLDADVTDPPCLFFSSASRFVQNVPVGFLATAVWPVVAGLTLPGVGFWSCRLASSPASCCMKFCCWFDMLSVTNFCGSERNCWMKSARFNTFWVDGEVSSFETAIAPALNVSSWWDGSKKESRVKPLSEVDTDLTSFRACDPALLMSSVPDCKACLLMLFQNRWGRSP